MCQVGYKSSVMSVLTVPIVPKSMGNTCHMSSPPPPLPSDSISELARSPIPVSSFR